MNESNVASSSGPKIYLLKKPIKFDDIHLIELIKVDRLLVHLRAINLLMKRYGIYWRCVGDGIISHLHFS